MSQELKQNLTQGSVAKHLLALGFPMLLAFAANLSYDLADTFYISKLGNDALIAMGFVNPVIFILLNIAVGFHVGLNSVLSRLIGQKANSTAAHLATATLVASLILGLIIAVLGVFTTSSLFSALGAKGEVLRYIVKYMQYVYPAIGVRFAVLTLMAVFLANGFTLFSGLTIVLSSLINIAIDPIFIFGWKFIPALGIEGAGLVNLISNLAIFSVLAYSASRRKILFPSKFLDSNVFDNKMFALLKNVTKIALPAAFANATAPLAQTIINKPLSAINPAFVAGFDMGYKIHFFSLMPVLALSSVLGPIVGQNLGAGKLERVREAIVKSFQWSFGFCVLIFIYFCFASDVSVRIFSANIDTLHFAISYLQIVAPTLFGFSFTMILAAAHDAAGHPYRSLGLIAFRSIAVFVVGTFICLQFFGAGSLQWWMAIANLVAAATSYWSFKKYF